MDEVRIKQIKETLQKTKMRRTTQRCIVREIKLSKNKLNKTTRHTLEMMFLEAKWFYNFIISQENIWTFDTKITKVLVMLKNKSFEEKELQFCPPKLSKEYIKE